MHPNALIDLTTQLVREVLKLDAPADSIVSYFFRKHKALGARERHALAETAYAVLRQRLLWAHLAQSGHGPMERRLVLLAWQGQSYIIKNGATADEQAWLARTATIDRSTLPDKLRHNMPDWLSNKLREQLDDASFWALVERLAGGAPLDLRVNAIKAKREDVLPSWPRRASRPSPRRTRPWASGSMASPTCRSCRSTPRAMSRCRTKAANCWPC